MDETSRCRLLANIALMCSYCLEDEAKVVTIVLARPTRQVSTVCYCYGWTGAKLTLVGRRRVKLTYLLRQCLDGHWCLDIRWMEAEALNQSSRLKISPLIVYGKIFYVTWLTNSRNIYHVSSWTQFSSSYLSPLYNLSCYSALAALCKRSILVQHTIAYHVQSVCNKNRCLWWWCRLIEPITTRPMKQFRPINTNLVSLYQLILRKTSRCELSRKVALDFCFARIAFVYSAQFCIRRQLSKRANVLSRHHHQQQQQQC